MCRQILLKKDEPPMKRLNMIMDNHARNNKNQMIIRAAAYLIETAMFQKMNLIFSIKGHTKNMCDEMFYMMTKITPKKY